MFKDELKSNLNIKSGLMPFALTMLSRGKLFLSGVKRVLKSDDKALCFRVADGRITVRGDKLSIKQMGGGDVYIIGRIGGIEIDD